MEQLDIAEVKKKSLRGVVALTSRTFVLQIIAFFATFLLTIYLTPSIFGVFYVVSAIISFLGYFSDVGLAAALIQKKETLTDSDLITTFTIQQTLVGIITVAALIGSPYIASFYGLNTDGVWLLRSLTFAFFMSSLKTIPSVLLERNLDFSKLVLPQILETVCFYLVAVILAIQGFGIVSFTWAVLVRSLVGVVAIYLVSPWQIRLGFSSHVAKRLLRYGVPFQLNSMMALVKDDLLTVYLGKTLTFTEIGYIGWAKKWAEVPLRLIMDSTIRVTFPTFSRLQHSKDLIGKAIETTLFGLALTIFPISVGLLFFMDDFVALVPRYAKWTPALFSFYVFVLGSALASLSTPLTNALNAVGKIKSTLLLMVMWTTSTWFLTLILIQIMGFNGVSVALLLITSSLAIVVAMAKKSATFSFWKSIIYPLFGAVGQGLFYYIFLQISFRNIVWLSIIGIVGVMVYGSIVWYFEKSRIALLISKFKPS